MKNIENRAKYHKNMKLAKAKLRHRINMHFKNFSKSYHKVLIANVIDNESKRVNELQDDAINKIIDECIRKGIKFEIVSFSQKELNKLSCLVMRKNERDEVYTNNKSVANRFKPVATIKKYFSSSHEDKVSKLRLGMVRRTKPKHSKMFLEDKQTAFTRTQEYLDFDNDERQDIIEFV